VRIRVLGFASAAALADAVGGELELAAGATVGELRRALLAAAPGAAGQLERWAVAVGGELAGAERTLEDGAEVALLPPVSGG